MVETAIPSIPDECDDFAKELSELCKKYSIEQVEAAIKIDTGYRSRYEERVRNGELLQNKMVVHVSLKDGRGRPRTQVRLSSEMYVQRFVIREPDSSS